MNKAEIRKAIRILLNFRGEKLIEWSHVISNKILSSIYYQQSKIILAYSALPDEVDITRVIDDALKNGKKVYLPKIDENRQTMKFYPYTNETELKSGAYGILEPNDKQTCFSMEKSESILVLVPGRAFTKDGKRLGRGKGFYDKFFQNSPENVKLAGVCFSEQIIQEIPVDSHDVFMKIIFSN